ncbi:hypothetical protein BMF77_01618 [Dolichospermum sp. UHCC 0315A]|nr:hypothetical protein BMF77_01618 [Dolichospermum sp. UHCC 0315A]
MTTEVLEETVVKLKPQEIEIENIDHLGIVAGIIDSIGIVEIINELIGVEKDEKVNAGQAHIPHPKMLQREITEMKIKGSIKTNR